MPDFRSTGTSNPCPVCGDTSNTCREKLNAFDQVTYLCKGYGDAAKFDKVPGFDGQVWFCSASQIKGIWATFHPHREQELSEEARAAHQAKIEAIRAEDEKRRAEALQNELPAAERDLHYKKLLSELTLSATDRANLHGRGLNDTEIELIGFKSVGKWHKLNNRYPDNLPGYVFKFGGSQIDIGGAGIFCPVRDHLGQIVGAQVRFSEATEGRGRHRWLSRDNSAYLNGENPITCCDLAIEGPQDRIWLTDSAGMKPAIANLRLKAPVIGAAGGLFASSPKNTRATLEHLASKYNTRQLILTIDAGDVINPHVTDRLERQVNWLEREGYRPLVAWWGQVDKTAEDIDELESFDAVEILHLHQFWKIVEQYKKPKKVEPPKLKPTAPRQERKAIEAIAESNTEAPERPKDWGWWIHKREFTPDLVQESEFVSFDAPAEGTILAVKSGLGSGKTHQLEALFAKGGPFEDKGAIALFSRNSLIYNFTTRIPSFSHLREELLILMKDPQSRLALCTNSIKKFSNPDWFRGKVLIIDEAMSVALHIAASATHRKDRVESLELFRQAIELSYCCIFLDGNFADWVAKWLADKAPNKRLIKLENRKQRAKAKVEILLGTPTKSGKFDDKNLSPFVAPMLSSVKPFIVFSDSQKLLEQIELLLVEAGLAGLRIDSKTVAPGTEARKCLDNANEWIDLNQPFYILCSPTAESGVDINRPGYFAHTYGLFRGVIGTDNSMQIMARNRCPESIWHISIPKQSFLRGNTDADLDTINAAAAKLVELAEMDISHLRLNKGWLGEQFLKLIEQAQTDPDNLFAITVAQKEAFERKNLQECLIFALEDAGHELEKKHIHADGKVEAALKLASEEVKKATAKEIFEAADITDEQAEKLTGGWNVTWPERVKLIKHSYKNLLPGIELTELWSADFVEFLKYDDPKAIRAAEFFYMFQNPETADKRQQNNWAKIATQRAIYLPDLHSPNLKIKALQYLKLERFIDREKVWHKDSPELLDLCKLGKRERIIAALGFKVPVITKGAKKGDIDAIRYLKKVLEVVGLKLGPCQKVQTNGERLNTYSLDDTWLDSPVRLAINEAIERRYVEFNSEWTVPEVLTVQTQAKAQETPIEVESKSEPSLAQVSDLATLQPEPDGINWREFEFAIKSEVLNPEVKIGDRVQVLSQPRKMANGEDWLLWVKHRVGQMLLKLSQVEMIFDVV